MDRVRTRLLVGCQIRRNIHQFITTDTVPCDTRKYCHQYFTENTTHVLSTKKTHGDWLYFRKTFHALNYKNTYLLRLSPKVLDPTRWWNIKLPVSVIVPTLESEQNGHLCSLGSERYGQTFCCRLITENHPFSRYHPDEQLDLIPVPVIFKDGLSLILQKAYKIIRVFMSPAITKARKTLMDMMKVE